MAANNVKKICDELGIKADVASVDFANAVGEKADLYVTIKELANQFPAHCHVAIIRSYVHKAKIAEDITDALMKIAATHLINIEERPCRLFLVSNGNIQSTRLFNGAYRLCWFSGAALPR